MPSSGTFSVPVSRTTGGCRMPTALMLATICASGCSPTPGRRGLSGLIFRLRGSTVFNSTAMRFPVRCSAALFSDDPSPRRSAVLPTPLPASARALRSTRPARGLREVRGRGGAAGDGAKRCRQERRCEHLPLSQSVHAFRAVPLAVHSFLRSEPNGRPTTKLNHASLCGFQIVGIWPAAVWLLQGNRPRKADPHRFPFTRPQPTSDARTWPIQASSFVLSIQRSTATRP